VTFALTAAACIHAGDEAAAAAVLDAARRAAAAGKRNKNKKTTTASARKGKATKGAAGGDGTGGGDVGQLKVIYEDEHVAAVSKPAGVLTHPVGGAAGGVGPHSYCSSRHTAHSESSLLEINAIL